jgi:hypothetical protein
MAEDDNIVIDGLGKGKINFGLVVMFHIDRTLKACAEPLALDEKCKDKFYNAVRGLAAILSPYTDDAYELEKNTIMALSEPRDSIASIDEYWMWFALLVRQIGKAGLLPADEVRIMDDYGESESDIVMD